MTSTNIADATHKLMRAELSDKNSLSYEEDVFKLIDEALKIIDRVLLSTAESNQESLPDTLDESFITQLRARAHLLRLSTWTGHVKQISAIKHSCSELGKINYVMNESEQHVFNNKLKIGLNQTICDFSSMIDDLKITDGIVKHTGINLNLHCVKFCQQIFNRPMKSRSSSYSPRKSKNAKISSDTSHKNHGNNEIESLSSINTNITKNITFMNEIMKKKSTTSTEQPDL